MTYRFLPNICQVQIKKYQKQSKQIKKNQKPKLLQIVERNCIWLYSKGLQKHTMSNRCVPANMVGFTPSDSGDYYYRTFKKSATTKRYLFEMYLYC